VSEHPADGQTCDWYFTFGYGQRLLAAHSDGGAQGDGFALDNFYMVIHGTFVSARAEMIRRVGQIWSSQYDPAEWTGQVELYGLTRLDIPPVPAMEASR
jgi:hypothetical protein